MNVIGYLRVSTAGQEESGLGLEAQLEKIRGYCALYDLNIVGVYQDAASGKSLKHRDGLQNALDDLRARRADGLIIAKLDRLTRSVRDLGELLDDHFQARSLVVVAEQVDTRTAAGRLVLNLLSSVSQWERETIGERTQDALQAKKRRGEKTGGDVPFGYDLADDGRTLVANEIEQHIIEQVQSLKAQGYSFNKIAAHLNGRGVQTKRGSAWTHVQISRIIRQAA
jgi:site-specific DNA recombinase